MQKKRLILLAAGFVFVAFCLLYLASSALLSPRIFFLPPSGGARWIVYPAPSNPMVNTQELTTVFRRSFTLEREPRGALLHVKAFRAFRLFLNGRELPAAADGGGNWKRGREFDLSGLLRKGVNNLIVAVHNDLAPPALWLRAEGLDSAIGTDERWTASLLNLPPARAVLASHPVYPPMVKGIAVPEALKKTYPVLLLCFVLTAVFFGLGSLQGGRRGRALFGLHITPSAAAAASLLLFSLLFFNNIGKVNILTGFDATRHLSYISHLVQEKRLPLPHEGWSTYHPPLYYVLSAAMLSASRSFLSEAGAFTAMKILLYACAAGQICLSWLAARILFPDAPRRQMLTVATAAAIPMNIYMSQYISNEMLHAFFSGLAFLVALHALKRGFNLTLTVALAAVAGLALMSKVSALPFVAVLGAVLTFELVLGERYSRRQALLYMAAFASVILLVSGWFFLRNYSLYGRLLIGNWEPDIFKKWWQFPGYRTVAYYFTVGKVFSFPYYSGFFSFLDSLYSTFWGDGFYGGIASSRGGPPWNYYYMSSVYLLGVPSTVMIVAGFAAMVRKAVTGLHTGWLLMASSLLVFFLFMVYLTLRVPFYSTAKSFYGLSLLVPLSLAHAWGVDTVDSWLVSRKLSLLRAALYGWLGTLVFCIYRSFFIP